MTISSRIFFLSPSAEKFRDHKIPSKFIRLKLPNNFVE